MSDRHVVIVANSKTGQEHRFESSSRARAERLAKSFERIAAPCMSIEIERLSLWHLPLPKCHIDEKAEAIREFRDAKRQVREQFARIPRAIRRLLGGNPPR